MLLVDLSLPRSQWSMGRVLADAKGGARSVEIKTKSGTITRPYSKVCLLEAETMEHPQRKDFRPPVVSEE